jgi:hypothetical protein
MTTLPFKLAVDPLPMQFLFTVRGKLATSDLESGRKVHNIAAGADQAVAAARSFGDLSHAVYVPIEPAGNGAGDLLIIDYWNSPQGLQAFFANMPAPTAETNLFRERDAVLWQGTAGLPRINLPAPTGRNERYVGIARGTVASREAAEKTLTEWARKSRQRAYFARVVFPPVRARREAIAGNRRGGRLVRRRRHGRGLCRPGGDGVARRLVYRSAGHVGLAEARRQLGRVVAAT